MPVMSVRLSEAEFHRLKVLATEEQKEKSSVARELLMDGLRYKMLLAYRDGHVSLSTLSQSLGLCVSEAIDLLASFGLQAPITYDEYLEGKGTLEHIIR